MRAILNSHPRAVWIVDMVSQQNLQELFQSDPGVAQAVRSIFASTDRSVVQSNPFQDDQDIEQCLAEHQLRVVNQFSLQATAARLVQTTSGRTLEGEFAEVCGSRKIWVIRSDDSAGTALVDFWLDFPGISGDFPPVFS
jgi:hypothetical protein